MTRHIDIKLDERVETGGLQIGDDWPGLFIRGDDCGELIFAIERVLVYMNPNSSAYYAINHVRDLILEEVVHRSKP